MSFKRYIAGLLFTCLVILAAAVGFNWLIDPYAIFVSARINGLNAIKPFAGDRGRTTKLYQPVPLQPAGLIAGNSRAEIGLDPGHPCWPQSSRPVYNAAIPGISVYQQVRYAQHCIAAGNVTAMVMSVDFLDYLQPPGKGGDPRRWPPRPERRQTFLVDPDGQPQTGRLWAKLGDYAGALVSLDATAHSVLTILQQPGGSTPTRTAQGFNPGERLYEPTIRYEGVHVLFEQKNREVMDRLTARQWTLTVHDTGWSADLEALRRMILHAKARNIDLALFVSPYHAEYLASIEIAGMWAVFEEWKRMLAALAKEHSVPLWDFALFDRYSTDDIANLRPTGESLDWFWEPAHYRKELGDLVLASIWRESCPAGTDVTSYGERIDGPGLDAHLTAQRAARDAYLALHPAVIRRLTRLRDGK